MTPKPSSEVKTEGMLEIERAINALYRMIEMYKSPTEDQVSMATMMLKNYEQQKASDYIHFLQEEILYLRNEIKELKDNLQP